MLSPQSSLTPTETLKYVYRACAATASSPTVSSAFQAPPAAPPGDVPPPIVAATRGSQVQGDGATWKRALLLGVIAGALVSILVLVAPGEPGAQTESNRQRRGTSDHDPSGRGDSRER